MHIATQIATEHHFYTHTEKRKSTRYDKKQKRRGFLFSYSLKVRICAPI
jgi:hypothetical protein